MIRLSSGPRVVAIVFLVGLFGLLYRPSFSWASCVFPSPQVKTDLLDGYENEPKTLLVAFMRGGYGMEKTVSQLAARGTTDISKIFAIARDATPVQRVSIGNALRETVNICEPQDAELVRAINQAVSDNNIRDVSHAFNQDTSDTPAVLPDGKSSSIFAQGPMTSTSSGQDATSALPEQFPDLFAINRTDTPDAGLADPFGPFSKWH